MKLLITTLTMIFISFGANSKSFEPFSVNECVDIYMEGKEALKNSIPIMGCRDQAASNYDYTATLDDGSCSYTEEGSNMMPLLVIGGIAAVVLLV